MTAFAEEDVISRLHEVIDPCSAATKVPLSIVQMGMADNVELASGNVVVALRMTSPLCHALPYFQMEIECVLAGIPGIGGVKCQGMESLTRVVQRIFGAAYDPPENVWLAVQFSPSEAGPAAGREFLKRKHLRREGRDPEVNDKVSPAQIEAMDKRGVQREGSYAYLKTIKQPTLVVNGSNDVIMPTINSFIMEQNILRRHRGQSLEGQST